MELTSKGLLHREDWQAKGYHLPEFDREAVKTATKEYIFFIKFFIPPLSLVLLTGIES